MNLNKLSLNQRLTDNAKAYRQTGRQTGRNCKKHYMVKLPVPAITSTRYNGRQFLKQRQGSDREREGEG